MAGAPPVARGRVRVDDLGFWYRTGTRPAFQGVSFDLAPSSCLLVVGPSGSGKSSLALAIAGLVPGAIAGELAGSMMVGGPAGVVFQDPGSQLVMERVEDEAAFGLENLGWSREAMLERVPEVLYDVGLADLVRRRSSRLSGGQQQRLALAGAVAPRPPILVLDEPTANLDPDGATAFFGRLRALLEEGSTTVVLVEHRVEAAWPLADVVLALDHDGRPIDVGPPDVVLARSGERLAQAGIWLPAPIEGTTPTDPGAQRRSRTKAKAKPAAAGHEDIRSAYRSSGEEPILSADGLRFAYEPGTPVIRDVSLSIAAGERIALLGPNGGGKSTLGRLLVGLLRPDHGVVDLAGRDPAHVQPGELARLAGYVFQDPEAGFLADTVAQEVGLGLRPDEAERVPALMRSLDLPIETFGSRSPYRLSGGEARRLSLAVALVRDPAVLVLDEPTFGQDRHGYDGLLRILLDRSAAGTTLVVATHDLRLVRDLGARVIEIDAGWLVFG